MEVAARGMEPIKTVLRFCLRATSVLGLVPHLFGELISVVDRVFQRSTVLVPDEVVQQALPVLNKISIFVLIEVLNGQGDTAALGGHLIYKLMGLKTFEAWGLTVAEEREVFQCKTTDRVGR